ncbi:hypothetical protein BpHYR1_011673 [Brachionus plicatilis]|uniref:Uncharacterized protein n=1 Tax=Brachionus plicatilis TaxID=10195 RepID=A0A3M7SK67_BRAPC|nr:hypothetical protein BpHYR1_011673 [Brachionus plicatilis]
MNKHVLIYMFVTKVKLVHHNRLKKFFGNIKDKFSDQESENEMDTLPHKKPRKHSRSETVSESSGDQTFIPNKYLANQVVNREGNTRKSSRVKKPSSIKIQETSTMAQHDVMISGITNESKAYEFSTVVFEVIWSRMDPTPGSGFSFRDEPSIHSLSAFSPAVGLPDEFLPELIEHQLDDTVEVEWLNVHRSPYFVTTTYAFVRLTTPNSRSNAEYSPRVQHELDKLDKQRQRLDQERQTLRDQLQLRQRQQTEWTDDLTEASKICDELNRAKEGLEQERVNLVARNQTVETENKRLELEVTEARQLIDTKDRQLETTQLDNQQLRTRVEQLKRMPSCVIKHSRKNH